jgi:hypothetical protein
VTGVKLEKTKRGAQPQHYVLITGKAGNRYTIADPLSPSPGFLDTYFTFETRGYVPDPAGDISELNISTSDTADLLLVDSLGNSTGFDAQVGQVVENIPNSVHFIDSLENDLTGVSPSHATNSIHLFQPTPGTYRLVLAGLQPGLFSVSIKVFNQDGSAQPGVAITALASLGSTSALQLQLLTAPGTNTGVVRAATYDSALADIANSLEQGLIDNAGIANSLAAKLQAAEAAGSPQQRLDVLGAFESELSAQSGKHIDPVAVQILSEDAMFLMNQ